MRIQDFPPVRTFTSAKLVKSPLLNRLGLQVGRTVAARMLYNIRPSKGDPSITDFVRELRSEGMVQIENFLPQDAFEQIKSECGALFDRDDERVQYKEHGPTRYEIAHVRKYDVDQLLQTRKFFEDPRLVGLLEAGEKRRLRGKISHQVVERVRQGESTTTGDPETALHSDIFFHTHKAWLYLTDVCPEDAPLVFVPRSHRLSREQAIRIYQHSCNPDTPSRRISDQELERLGLQETTVEAKANTLVVANVCGYHRRSIGQVGGSRMALHCSIRTQPFFRIMDRFLGS